MASTVIDSLVVLLGLDASNYKKGRETAEKETSETARKAKLGADEITKSLTEVGKTIAGLFLGFETATGLVKWLGGLTAGEAALGRTAKQIGMSGHELNKWGNAVELAGGKAEDFQSAALKLTEDFTKFQATGEQSALLAFIQNRGVAVADENNKLRNRGEIFEELADKTAKYGAQYQTTMFRQAGLNDGEINYLIQSKELRKQQRDEAERNNGVTEQSIAQAQKLEQEWRAVSQEITAAGQAVVKDLAPAVLGVLHTVSDIVASLKFVHDSLVTPDRNSAGAIADRKAVANIKYAGYLKAHPEVTATKTPEQVIKEAADKERLGDAATPAADSPVTYRNHNPGNLRPYRDDQARDKRNIRVFASDEEGKAALDADLRAKMNEGLNTIQKIITKYAPSTENDTGAYISAVSKDLGKSANAPLTSADISQLARAITIHEGAQVKAPQGSAGNQTTVDVGSIIINAPSADPRSVAEQVPAAIQRKLSVSQADTGQS